jgi:hypothetical protein
MALQLASQDPAIADAMLNEPDDPPLTFVEHVELDDRGGEILALNLSFSRKKIGPKLQSLLPGFD